MKQNLLDHIRIASPCSADWDAMRGDNRSRYCSQCKLNVYNVSEMTMREAENLVFEKEGKMCVRLYKRNDGTVITQDCPIGWQAIKRKVSRTVTAAFSLFAGFFGGFFATSNFVFDNSKLIEEVTVEKERLREDSPIITTGLPVLPKSKKERKRQQDYQAIVGSVENIRALEDEPVELWIK